MMEFFNDRFDKRAALLAAVGYKYHGATVELPVTTKYDVDPGTVKHTIAVFTRMGYDSLERAITATEVLYKPLEAFSYSVQQVLKAAE